MRNEILEWFKSWYKENAVGCTAVLGISGGLDSSLAAAMAKEVFGKHKVFGVMMPNGTQADLTDSYDLVRHLGIDFEEINIASIYDSMNAALKIIPGFDGVNYVYRTNTPARIRTTIIYGVAAQMNGRVIGTNNLSEDFTGYFTKGSTVCDVAPLANLTKTEIKALAYEMGLPEHLIEKRPADGLSMKSDEDNFGFSYAELDQYLRTGWIDSATSIGKIDKLFESSKHKRCSAPSFPYGEVKCKPGVKVIKQ